MGLGTGTRARLGFLGLWHRGKVLQHLYLDSNNISDKVAKVLAEAQGFGTEARSSNSASTSKTEWYMSEISSLGIRPFARPRLPLCPRPGESRRLPSRTEKEAPCLPAATATGAERWTDREAARASLGGGGARGEALGFASTP